MFEQRLAMATCFIGDESFPVPPPDIRQGPTRLAQPYVPIHRDRPNILCSVGDLPSMGSFTVYYHFATLPYVLVSLSPFSPFLGDFSAR